MPETSKLLVRDPGNSWYNAGLPGVGYAVEEIAAQIEVEVAKLGAKRVITVGPSMGGYASILFGCLIGAERAIALAPQTFLDPVLPHAPPADVELQVPDLRSVLREAPATQVDLVAGWDALIDVFHARRVARFPQVRVLALEGYIHSFMSALHEEGKLLPLVIELTEGGTQATQEIAPVGERYPDWAGPSFALGQALAKLEEWDQAVLVLERAVRANPHWAQPAEILAQATREARQ